MSSPSIQPYVANAVIFTNNLGQVIFVDQVFLNIMQYPDADAVTGEPLFKALRLDQEKGKRLLEDLRKTGNIRDRPLEIADPSGAPFRLFVSGTATYDPNGNFLGADIMLRKPVVETPADDSEDEIADETIPTRQALSETASSQNSQFLEFYFTTHVKALYVLFQRLVGLVARDHLDKLINETSKKRGWALHIKNGLFVSTLSGTSSEAYRVLLAEVIGYGVNMIGSKLVTRSIDKVDEQLHEGLIALAQQEGLYQLYKTK
jgi:hypothetical protein